MNNLIEFSCFFFIYVALSPPIFNVCISFLRSYGCYTHVPSSPHGVTPSVYSLDSENCGEVEIACFITIYVNFQIPYIGLLLIGFSSANRIILKLRKVLN